LAGAYYGYRAHDENTNSQGVSLKRLTCLAIGSKINCYIENNASLLFLRERLVFSVAHFILAALSPVYYSEFRKNHSYVESIRLILKDNFNDILCSSFVPITYKMYLIMARIDIRFVAILRYFKKISRL